DRSAPGRSAHPGASLREGLTTARRTTPGWVRVALALAALVTAPTFGPAGPGGAFGLSAQQAAADGAVPVLQAEKATGITPGGACLRALLVPGWGHGATESYTRAGFYV